jgi:hypothetical protein
VLPSAQGRAAVAKVIKPWPDVGTPKDRCDVCPDLISYGSEKE